MNTLPVRFNVMTRIHGLLRLRARRAGYDAWMTLLVAIESSRSHGDVMPKLAILRFWAKRWLRTPLVADFDLGCERAREFASEHGL